MEGEEEDERHAESSGQDGAQHDREAQTHALCVLNRGKRESQILKGKETSYPPKKTPSFPRVYLAGEAVLDDRDAGDQVEKRPDAGVHNEQHKVLIVLEPHAVGHPWAVLGREEIATGRLSNRAASFCERRHDLLITATAACKRKQKSRIGITNNDTGGKGGSLT